jgi:hypothetical protein
MEKNKEEKKGEVGWVRKIKEVDISWAKSMLHDVISMAHCSLWVRQMGE